MKILIDIPEEEYKNLAYANHFKLRSYIENGEVVKAGQWEWVPFGYPSILGNWVCSKCKCVAVEAVSKENKHEIPTHKYCPRCGQPKIQEGKHERMD